MRFATIAICVGLAGTVLASNLQGAVMVNGEGLPATILSEADVAAVSQADITGSVQTRSDETAPEAMRLIDLRSGATCKVARPDPQSETFQAVPFGPDCARSPGLSRIAFWRSTPDGALIMADRGGGTVLEFAPGDGVLYESVFPENELITIVPAKS